MTLRIAVLGSTGSIGTQTLDIVRTSNHAAQQAGQPAPYEVVAIGASGLRPDPLIVQAKEFDVALVCVSEPSAVPTISEALSGTEVASGDAGVQNACALADVVINGIVGFAGLAATL